MSVPNHGRPPAATSARSRARQGFDFTEKMRLVCADIVRRMPPLAHIDVHRVAVAFAQTRKRTSHGLFASVTPMRFEGGALSGFRYGRRYTVQRLYDQRGREYLYILTFYLPRFMDQSFEEKLNTIFHELWHISPEFDGDLRRHHGRCYAHTHSQKRYDAAMDRMVRAWLADSPPQHLYEFLRYSFRQLQSRHGTIVGAKIPRPKLIPAS